MTLHAGTVIVHILAAVLRRLAGLSQPLTKVVSSASLPAASSSSSPSSSAQPLPPIPTVYIACDSPFAKLEDFIRDSQRRYNLDLYTVTGGMKEGLIEYFAGGGEAGVPEAGRKEKGGVEAVGSTSRRQRDVKAIFIGTRRTDPNGGEQIEAIGDACLLNLLLTISSLSLPLPPRIAARPPMDRSIMAASRAHPRNPRLGLCGRMGILEVSSARRAWRGRSTVLRALRRRLHFAGQHVQHLPQPAAEERKGWRGGGGPGIVQASMAARGWECRASWQGRQAARGKDVVDERRQAAR